MTAVLPFQQFQYDFARHIRAPRQAARPDGVTPRGMRVYNELLHNNVKGFIDACFPVARSILNERRWQRLCRAFFVEWRSHTPYFREIPREFLRWMMEREQPLDVPPYLIELLHYEWAELAVDVMEASQPQGLARDGDLLADCPVLNPALMSLGYQWPVHRIGPTCRPRKPQPVQLVVYRKLDDKVAFLEINPVAARLLALLQTGQCSGRAALEAIAEALGYDEPRAVIDHGKILLHDLRREEVILGVNACHNS